MAKKSETASKKAPASKPVMPARPRGAVVKGRAVRGRGLPVGVVPHGVKPSADPIGDDFVDIHRIAAKHPHLGLPALASALEAAFRRMVARLGKK